MCLLGSRGAVSVSRPRHEVDSEAAGPDLPSALMSIAPAFAPVMSLRSLASLLPTSSPAHCKGWMRIAPCTAHALRQADQAWYWMWLWVLTPCDLHTYPSANHCMGDVGACHAHQHRRGIWIDACRWFRPAPALPLCQHLPRLC